MFNKIHIVRKLNAKDDPFMRQVETSIRVGVPAPVVEESEVDQKTLVIAIGGDGTMLEAMRIAHAGNAFVVGINLGRVGFLTDFAPDSRVVSEILGILAGEHPIEERIALQYTLVDKGEVDMEGVRPAFNEFVISNKFSDQLLKYTLFIGNRRAGVHRANALIISTPTGSTAYNLSAGGGLLLPSMEAVQIVPVAPISITSRPIIIPSNEEISLSVETQGEWILKADGTTVASFDSNLSVDTQIVITQHLKKVKIVHSKYWSFFAMLTNKLGWKSDS